jgi:ketosteroid isomerase-like protein
MSQENIELHERRVAAINAREIPDELLLEICAPDCRMENLSTAVTDKTYYGADGLRQWVSDLFEGFEEDACFETEEVLADGEDFVVARMRVAGRGARSGAPLVLRWVTVFWFRDGKMTRTAGYARRREALKAVGLEV